MGYTAWVIGSNRVTTGGQAGGARRRVERARQEEQRHYQHLRQRHECLDPRNPGGHHNAERGPGEGKQKELTDYLEDKDRVRRHMRKPGQCQNDESEKRGNRRADEAFPDNDG
jgi:hypothetical protein